jgi:hypothetical protein
MRRRGCAGFGVEARKADLLSLASKSEWRWRMDVHLAEELLNELGSSLEMLETQQGALLQFLKDKGVITDEQFAPYLTQAGNASNVRWRAARLRLEHIMSAIRDKEQLIRKQAEHESRKPSHPLKNRPHRARPKGSKRRRSLWQKSRHKIEREAEGQRRNRPQRKMESSRLTNRPNRLLGRPLAIRMRHSSFLQNGNGNV